MHKSLLFCNSARVQSFRTDTFFCHDILNNLFVVRCELRFCVGGHDREQKRWSINKIHALFKRYDEHLLFKNLVKLPLDTVIDQDLSPFSVPRPNNHMRNLQSRGVLGSSVRRSVVAFKCGLECTPKGLGPIWVQTQVIRSLEIRGLSAYDPLVYER